MTTWLPEIQTRVGPRYLAIADTLAADVAAGRLPPGARLPTHRDLAWKLGVTVGTVTRAYAEAERRGLIAGEVGRGTFIRERGGDVLPTLSPPTDGFVDLTRNFPPEGPHNKTIAETLAAIAAAKNISSLLAYTSNVGLPAHREAGAAWVRKAGLDARPSEIAVTNGAQHGSMVAMATLTRPGDVVLTEQLTFYGVKSIATLLSLQLHGVAIDEYGLVPDALDAACRQTQARVLYCIPTIHNPTAAVMPAARREEIAAICQRHAVTIVEDDIYGFLPDHSLPPLSSFAPERSIYVTGLSKCVAPGLRVGYLRATESMVARLSTTLRATVWMAVPLMAEVAARMIEAGSAEKMALWQREEAKARQSLARRALGNADIDTHPASFHIWLKLPEPWRREEFVAEARRRGVGIAPAEAFAIGRGPLPHAVRIGLSAARDRAQLEHALNILVDILRGTPEQGLAMV
ncbi:MAG: PLP-dependent aminotransferase family protein [Rhodospirillales bacterium]|nr:PLP-dependent aminotransferase family protein [Rhodospirillales bacterium]